MRVEQKQVFFLFNCRLLGGVYGERGAQFSHIYTVNHWYLTAETGVVWIKVIWRAIQRRIRILCDCNKLWVAEWTLFRNRFDWCLHIFGSKIFIRFIYSCIPIRLRLVYTNISFKTRNKFILLNKSIELNKTKS